MQVKTFIVRQAGMRGVRVEVEVGEVVRMFAEKAVKWLGEEGSAKGMLYCESYLQKHDVSAVKNDFLLYQTPRRDKGYFLLRG